MDDGRIEKSRELRQVVDAVLAKYGIVDLQLSIDIVQAVTDMGSMTRSGVTREDAKKRIIDAMSGAAKIALDTERIQHAFREKLHISASRALVDFVRIRERHGESLDTFVEWWIKNGGQPMYWTEKRMMMLWPQAFQRSRPSQPKEQPEVRTYGE